jgi:hypothetical protein
MTPLRRVADSVLRYGVLRLVPPATCARALRSLATRTHVLASLVDRVVQERNYVPAILLNTLPKSASLYVLQTLERTLNVESFIVSSRDFVRATITPQLFYGFGQGRRILHDHLPPVGENLYWIAREVDRFVVHVRDPRQAILSWAHDRGKRLKKYGAPFRQAHVPALPPDYLERELTARLDIHIQNDYPHMVEWIRSWLAVSRDPAFTPRILFTRYEDLLRDQESFFKRIFEFYDLDANLRLIRGERGPDQNFRSGLVDEWRTVFTPEQSAHVTNLIPQELWDQFGWER